MNGHNQSGLADHQVIFSGLQRPKGTLLLPPLTGTDISKRHKAIDLLGKPSKVPGGRWRSAAWGWGCPAPPRQVPKDCKPEGMGSGGLLGVCTVASWWGHPVPGRLFPSHRSFTAIRAGPADPPSMVLIMAGLPR